MAVNIEAYNEIRRDLPPHVTLVAVSKTKPIEDILELYELGQRDFGENYVQELTDKYQQLPKDIRWHFIGHLQSNKVKYIAPFIHLVHSLDSYKLLQEINKEAGKLNRVVDVLLQLYVATEETKYGMDKAELTALTEHVKTTPLKNVGIRGFMGMASFTTDAELIRREFRILKLLADSVHIPAIDHKVISMGMSADYKIAIEEGSTMVRIGSVLFGERNKK